VDQAEDKTKKWQRAALDFAGVLERVSNPDSDSELSPEYAKAAKYLAKQFVKVFNPLGFQLLQPEAGDAYHADAHDVAGREASETVAVDCVIRCTEWGIVFGDKITAKAKVVISSGKRPLVIAPLDLANVATKPPGLSTAEDERFVVDQQPAPPTNPLSRNRPPSQPS
jgi:hypothetical protein